MGPAEKVTAGLDAAEDTGTGRLRREAIAAVVTTRAPQRTPDQPCADCLDQPTAGRGRLAVPRRVAFWLVALVLAATMMGTTLPTPLYVIYQAQWHFSAAMVTVTFAVYAAGVLAALLLAGRSSDQAGRRPVLGAVLGASALSTVVFILAPDLGALIAARIVSGLSAGLMTGTATATLTELVPAGRRASLVATAANMGGPRTSPTGSRIGVTLNSTETRTPSFRTAGMASNAAPYRVTPVCMTFPNPSQCRARNCSGMIRSRLWPTASAPGYPKTALAITLEANPGFGRLYATAAQADASPGALSANGASFTVTWQHPEVQMPARRSSCPVPSITDPCTPEQAGRLLRHPL